MDTCTAGMYEGVAMNIGGPGMMPDALPEPVLPAAPSVPSQTMAQPCGADVSLDASE